MKVIIQNNFINKNIKVLFDVNSTDQFVNFDFRIFQYLSMILLESIYDEGFNNIDYIVNFLNQENLIVKFKFIINDLQENKNINDVFQKVFDNKIIVK